MKKIFVVLFIIMIAIMIMGCSDADVASQNLSKAADQFEIYRRVVFYNGITDQYILQVEGFCSIKVDGTDGQLELTVKNDNGTFLKHYLGLSDNVTYFVEQLDSSTVSDAHYRVIFKPSVIIPNVDLE
jgi:hypothetical protein